MTFVSILVINWNGKKWLRNCLSSILLQKKSNDFEVILIDNCSTDGSVDYVRNCFPKVNVIELDRNYGFAEGNNRGLKYAKGEYLIFVNMDVEAYSEWLNNLAIAADEHPEYQILCSIELPESENSTIRSINALGDVPLGLKCQRDITESLFAYGSGFLIRKKWLDKLGYLFDPYYFGYAEDLELSLRTILLGGRIGYVKNSKMYHLGGGSGLDSQTINYLDTRNKLFTYYKLLTTQNFVRLCSANIAYKSIISLRKKNASDLLTFARALIAFLLRHNRYVKYHREFSKAKRIDDKHLLRKLLYRSKIERKLFKKFYRI